MAESGGKGRPGPAIGCWSSKSHGPTGRRALTVMDSPSVLTRAAARQRSPTALEKQAQDQPERRPGQRRPGRRCARLGWAGVAMPAPARCDTVRRLRVGFLPYPSASLHLSIPGCKGHWRKLAAPLSLAHDRSCPSPKGPVLEGSYHGYHDCYGFLWPYKSGNPKHFC